MRAVCHSGTGGGNGSATVPCVVLVQRARRRQAADGVAQGGVFGVGARQGDDQVLVFGAAGGLGSGHGHGVAAALNHKVVSALVQVVVGQADGSGFDAAAGGGEGDVEGLGTGA